jgi:hypothetical protein
VRGVRLGLSSLLAFIMIAYGRICRVVTMALRPIPVVDRTPAGLSRRRIYCALISWNHMVSVRHHPPLVQDLGHRRHMARKYDGGLKVV